MMARILVAVLIGVEMDGTFATIPDDKVNFAGDIEELCSALKASRSRLRGVELGDMTVFGPWWAFDDIPADVKEATKGRGRDPAATLSTLVDGKERAYFIVRITAPLAATAAGASVIAIVGLPQ